MVVRYNFLYLNHLDYECDSSCVSHNNQIRLLQEVCLHSAFLFCIGGVFKSFFGENVRRTENREKTEKGEKGESSQSSLDSL